MFKRLRVQTRTDHSKSINVRKNRNSKFRLLTFCIISAALVFGIGCGISKRKEDKIVIKVGSTRITVGQLKEDMEFVSAEMDVPIHLRHEIRDQLLEKIIDHYLILEYGKKEGIALSEDKLQNALRKFKKEYSEKGFQEELLRGYVDFEQWKKRLKEQLLVRKIIEEVSKDIPPPTHHDIKQYFEKNIDEFNYPEKVKFRQIVTRTEEEANKILKRLQNGESMEALAKKYSIAPEAEKGGNVGWVAREHLDESMEKALFSLSKGKISPVIKTPYGYHIFEVISFRAEGRQELPDVMQEIESKLMNQRREEYLKNWLSGLRSRIKVRINQKTINTLEIS